MLRVVSLFSLLSLSFAIYSTRCGIETDTGTTFKPTEDGVEGRYTLEWCSKIPDDASLWKLQLESINTTKCYSNISAIAMYSLKSRKGNIHSVVSEPIEGNFGCNITCLSTMLDLVFSSCYLSENQVLIGESNGNIDRAMLSVVNRFSGAGAFNNMTPHYKFEKEGDYLNVTWNLHYVPISEYSVEISPYINENKTFTNWTPIHNCTHELYKLTCRILAPAPEQCVAAQLQHEAPWHSGPLFPEKPVIIYCSPLLAGPALRAARWAGAALWAAGAALLALLLLLLALAARARLLRALRKRTLRDWTQRYAQYKAGRAPRPEEPAHILLLYARDCAPAMDVVAALKDLLQAGAPARPSVLDLFAPETAAAYAAAPQAWLRGVLARPGLRVLLVQTPAAAALYGAPPLDDALRLQEPLLGRVVQYRAPHFADALLQYALRVVRDTAHEQPEYTKYYIATVAALPGDAVPLVAAYRRYELPAHAHALLLALAGAGAGGGADLRALAAAVARLQAHVRARPDYLKDELDYLPAP